MEEQAVSKPCDGSLLLQMLRRWPIHPARCGSPGDPPPCSRDRGSLVSCSPFALAGAVRPPPGAGRQPASSRAKGSSAAGRRPPVRQGRCSLVLRRPPAAVMGLADSPAAAAHLSTARRASIGGLGRASRGAWRSSTSPADLSAAARENGGGGVSVRFWTREVSVSQKTGPPVDGWLRSVGFDFNDQDGLHVTL